MGKNMIGPIYTDIAIIGAGASGLMAANYAAVSPFKVAVVERNDAAGRKLSITGKGRCNIANSADMETTMRNIPGNGKFLYSALSAVPNTEVIAFFNRLGVKTELERGGRYFTRSGDAREVVRALLGGALSRGADVFYGARAESVRLIGGECGNSPNQADGAGNGANQAGEGARRAAAGIGESGGNGEWARGGERGRGGEAGSGYGSSSGGAGAGGREFGDAWRFAIRTASAAGGASSGGGAAHGKSEAGALPGGRRELYAKRLIIATGGLSYPRTGSTGDGYRLAEALGHSVVPPNPSLVPLETAEEWPRRLSGLTLKNVALKLFDPRGKQCYRALGEMLFTHFGISGPLVLSGSRHLIAHGFAGCSAQIDLKPGLTREKLCDRISRDLGMYAKKRLRGALADLMPQSLIPIVIGQTGIEPETPAGGIGKSGAGRIADALKGIRLTVSGSRPIDEAIVTAGGVSTREINPSTMESKLIPGLYFCGELIDVDAYTGGFNLNIAFSTGSLAGRSAAAAPGKPAASLGKTAGRY